MKENYENYCGLNLMLDEGNTYPLIYRLKTPSPHPPPSSLLYPVFHAALANVTCALNAHNLADNTIFVVVSDNGGYKTMTGNNYPLKGDFPCPNPTYYPPLLTIFSDHNSPWKGSAGTFFRGGVSSTAFVHSPLIGSKYRGSTYTGTMHVVDWLPTLMHAATNGAWSAPLSGQVIDGIDLWDEIRKADGSGAGREEIVFYASQDKAVIQQVGHPSPRVSITFPPHTCSPPS